MKIWSFALVFLLLSCNNVSERNRVEYFDMEGLVAQQVLLLAERNPSMLKKASINGKHEELKINLDSAGWASELNIFLQSDLNKPNLFGNYNTIEENESGATKTIIYEAKNPDIEQIDYLELVYYDDQLEKVESLFTEKNLLYNTSRRLVMHFDKLDGITPVLSAFSIEGKQKMILKDSILYTVEAKLLY